MKMLSVSRTIGQTKNGPKKRFQPIHRNLPEPSRSSRPPAGNRRPLRLLLRPLAPAQLATPRLARPDSPALIDSATGRRVSYPEFARLVANLSAHLRAVTKLNKGDVAFVLSPNSVHVPILYFSLLSIGVAVSPANPSNTGPEIARLVRISDPAIAFATSATASKIKIQTLRRGIVLLDSPEFDSMMAAAGSGPSRRLGGESVAQSDLAAVMYSSGTTGRVKGVALSHRNLAAIVAGYYAERPEGEAVVMYTVPYFHVFGFFCCLKAVALGETVVVMGRFDLGKMLRAVGDYRVTQIAVAPPVVAAMTRLGVVGGYDLGSLGSVACGGAALGKEAIAAFTARFPTVQLTQGYGTTETAGTVFRLLGPEEMAHWGSAGRLSVNFEAKVVNPDTYEPLPPCRQGELWLRGASVMKGYIGDEEATRATLVSDGWLRTGDLVYFDEQGYIFIVDRLKELIKYKGYQVAPAELEQLLQSHPHIVDAAVIPYPDEEAGQIPMAFILRRPQSNLEPAEIMEFVAKQVAPYKKIRRVAFVNSIPKSPAGKILRRELRSLILSGSSSKL